MNANAWTTIRGRLGDEQVAAAVARGQGMGADEAISLALAAGSGHPARAGRLSDA